MSLFDSSFSLRAFLSPGIYEGRVGGWGQSQKWVRKMVTTTFGKILCWTWGWRSFCAYINVLHRAQAVKLADFSDGGQEQGASYARRTTVTYVTIDLLNHELISTLFLHT